MNLKRQNFSSLSLIGKCIEPPDWVNEAFLFGFVLQRLLNLEAPLSYESNYQIVGQMMTFPSALVQVFGLTSTLGCYLRLGSLRGGGEAVLFIDLLRLHNVWYRFTEFHSTVVLLLKVAYRHLFLTVPSLGWHRLVLSCLFFLFLFFPHFLWIIFTT